MSSSILPGCYRHFKGGLYEVLGVARHSETEAELVVYRPLYGERGLWVRPRDLFEDQVTMAGTRVPRFVWIGAAASPETRQEEAS